MADQETIFNHFDLVLFSFSNSIIRPKVHDSSSTLICLTYAMITILCYPE
jgi:hypothetical protein